jgi:hypothetical protein
MLIWAVFDCRYKLEQVGASWKEQKRRKIGVGHGLGAYIGTSRRLDYGPSAYITLNRLH